MQLSFSLAGFAFLPQHFDLGNRPLVDGGTDALGGRGWTRGLRSAIPGAAELAASEENDGHHEEAGLALAPADTAVPG